MAMVSPSILSADFAHLGSDCRAVLDAGAQMLHYDVMDGHFVPNISFGVPVLKSLHKALPDAFYDVHLMIDDPLTYAEPFAKAGASLITFHLECGCDTAAHNETRGNGNTRHHNQQHDDQAGIHNEVSSRVVAIVGNPTKDCTPDQHWQEADYQLNRKE